MVSRISTKLGEFSSTNPRGVTIDAVSPSCGPRRIACSAAARFALLLRQALAICWSRRRASCSTEAAAPEIILNNIGEEVATYRVSVELRRMTPDGMLNDVADPSAAEKLAQSLIMYAPRRVTLAPREPQTIRISARAPKDLPDGEYRVHLLFRAVPPPTPVEAAPKEQKGISFKLTTIYGVTIPVIARFGNLEAQGRHRQRQADPPGREASRQPAADPQRRPFDLWRGPRDEGGDQGPDRGPARRRRLYRGRRARGHHPGGRAICVCRDRPGHGSVCRAERKRSR